MKKQSLFIKALAVVLVSVITLSLAACSDGSGNDDFNLTDSKGVKVSYVDTFPADTAFPMQMDESDVFEKYADLIFSGAVTKIENISIDYGKKDNRYFSIVTVKATEILKGDKSANDSITLLIPASINTDSSWMNTEMPARALRENSEAIFITYKYGENDKGVSNNNTFYYKDICEYGLFDGGSFVFADNGGTLAYHTGTYPTITETCTLAQVAEYLKGMIND